MSTPLTHLLVVDDDARLRSLLAKYLAQEGFTVTVATDAADARAKLAFFTVDALILDVMMPGETGTELAASLRAAGHTTPILMLTAMGEAHERIGGLEAGADDYLVKPFEPRELLLRLRNLLRRGGTGKSAVPTGSLRFGEFLLDVEGKRLLRDNIPVYLTTAEHTLLFALARQPGLTLSRSELAEALSADAGNERSVDVQITRLRKKIEPEPARPVYIQTVRGAGYILRAS